MGNPNQDPIFHLSSSGQRENRSIRRGVIRTIALAFFVGISIFKLFIHPTSPWKTRPSPELLKHLKDIKDIAFDTTIFPEDGNGVNNDCAWGETEISFSRCDLQVLFRRLVARVPFSYAHFDSGEILAKNPLTGTTTRDETQTLSPELQEVMNRTIHAQAPGLVFGIPCKKDESGGFLYEQLLSLDELEKSPVEKTISNLFVDSNYQDARLALLTYVKRNPDRKVHLVVSEEADMEEFELKTGMHPASVTRVPAKDAFPVGYNNIANKIKHHKQGDIVILCAGILGRILAVEWFEKRPKTTYLDLGSFFDVELMGESHGKDYHTANPRLPMCN
eukprot:CAMPEP_0183734758 /NCGR_PEP_ID=MMETSP0737-20130205/44747_1 /TAXON_ID=385413 /ORGANISM="Thalassiosira miniscula, Strain CCMP1093" /LENGTH=332 /DNA_ID=CAMNT_0025968339 /DNA_START=46 /DNA_END=1041 /DNA_ORIENTATION=+